MTTHLPYFDVLFDWRRAGDADAAVFDRFVHWGVWWPSDRSDGSQSDLRNAMERLNAHVLSWALLNDGQDVLDVGCGFGGTLDSIAADYPASRLTGLNIDPRQLEQARQTCKQPANGSLAFVEGDAVAMPFEASSFDRVLAVECAFHFPSRLEFLREAMRVLRPGGRLIVSDFVPVVLGVPLLVSQGERPTT